MGNTSYITDRRVGTRAGCADGRVRIAVTLSEAVFQALKARAVKNNHSLSGEAANLIEDRMIDDPPVAAQEAP
jgi:hypothetical protein